MKNSTVILFDIDYTLFDQGKYRTLVFNRLQELLPQVKNVATIAEQAYEEVRTSGWFEVEKFTKQLARNISTTVDEKKLADVWRDSTLLERAIYPEAERVLVFLSNKGYILGIFSSGVENFQKSKIEILINLFDEEHIHIHELKDEKFPEIVDKYKEKKIILIDDYIPVLEKAKQTDPAITTIWMKRGKLSQKIAPSELYPPDYIVEDLEAILPLIEKIS